MMRGRKDDTSGASETELRARLLTHVYPDSASSQQTQPTYSQAQQPNQASPHHSGAHNIDPAIAGHHSAGASPDAPGQVPPPPMMSHTPLSPEHDDGGQNDPKKGGKRELSTSKRAAQNRAAQRAFRQRKEGHIKKLEEQVREYGAMMENYKRMQNENYSLREYIISLQSRLLESQGELPPAPLNIDLSGPRDHAAPLPPSAAAPPSVAPAAPMSAGAASALQGIAKGASNDVTMADRTDPALTRGAA